MNISINKIITAKRQRVEFGDIDKLTASIKQHGLLQPLLVESQPDGTFLLIDGFRRLQALKKLEWSEIPVFVKNNLTDTQKQEMEFVADTERKDRTWQERSLTFLKLHRLKRLHDPLWSQRQLSEMLNVSIGNINEILQVASALEKTRNKEDEWSKGFWSCPSVFEAVRYLIAKNEDEVYAEIARRKAALTTGVVVLSPTDSFNESVGQETLGFVAPRKVQWNNRVPEKDECKTALILKNVDIGPAFLYSSKSALLWGQETVNDWIRTMDSLTNKGYTCAHFPLIWNTVTGIHHPNLPFQQSYRLGLFVYKENCEPPSPTKPGVFTEYCNEAMFSDSTLFPLNALRYMLDIISIEGDKIWLPFGGPIVTIYQLGRIPVWQNGPDDETLKLQFRKQFGEKIQFI